MRASQTAIENHKPWRMIMLNRYIVRAAAIAVSIAAATSASAQGTVKVGMVMPLTGSLAAAGKQVLAGARLYMKQHGEMVTGKKIELIVKDDASSGETGKRLIQDLIINDKVDVIGGGLTADLLPSATLFTEAAKPAVVVAVNRFTRLGVPDRFAKLDQIGALPSPLRQ